MMSVILMGSTLGKIFQPVFEVMAKLIAAAYAVVPNYTIAIAFLTLVVMLVTAPLTVKSTRSMTAMQKLAPEMKKLQQKYKGDRQRLNEEMMALYKEHGVNPAGGCLPLLLQFPIFIVLYDVIRGLTNTVTRGHMIASAHQICRAAICADPRYINTNTKLYVNLRANSGKMPSFGIDLASKVLGHHSVVAALPYALLIAIAIGLQYLQMRLLNNRNPGAAQANPQAMMMQRYMPLIFAVIYINIPAAVNIYFIASNLCRIGLQSYAFHTSKAEPPGEVKIPGRSGGGAPGGGGRRRTLMERLADAQRQALDAQQARRQALEAGSTEKPKPEVPHRDDPPKQAGGAGNGPSGARGTNNGRGAGSGGQRSIGSGSAENGSQAPKPHPRSKAKRTRKAR